MTGLTNSDSRWLKQTVAGGTDLPPQQRGDCVGAVLASLLHRPIETISNTHGEGWWERLQEEVKPFGYWLARLEDGQGWPKGYWIAVVPSQNFKGSTHVVVCKGNQIVHDPSPLKAYGPDAPPLHDLVIEMWALVPLDPAVAA